MSPKDIADTIDRIEAALAIAHEQGADLEATLNTAREHLADLKAAGNPAPAPMSNAPTPSFQEPWGFGTRESDTVCTYGGDGYVIYRKSSEWQFTKEQLARIIECVNALAGIHDPLAFVTQARALQEAHKMARIWPKTTTAAEPAPAPEYRTVPWPTHAVRDRTYGWIIVFGTKEQMETYAKDDAGGCEVVRLAPPAQEPRP